MVICFFLKELSNICSSPPLRFWSMPIQDWTIWDDVSSTDFRFDQCIWEFVMLSWWVLSVVQDKPQNTILFSGRLGSILVLPPEATINHIGLCSVHIHAYTMVLETCIVHIHVETSCMHKQRYYRFPNQSKLYKKQIRNKHEMMYEQQKTPFTSQSSHFPAKTLSKEDGVQVGPSDAGALYLRQKRLHAQLARPRPLVVKKLRGPCSYSPEELPSSKNSHIAIEHGHWNSGFTH